MIGLNKILALYVGPSGYAAIGQFQNAIQIITRFASGAINTGVTKYTAQYCNEKEKQRAVWRTAGTIALVASVVCSVFIALSNETLAHLILSDSNLGGVFLWFSATITLFVFNALLLSILNGKKRYLDML